MFKAIIVDDEADSRGVLKKLLGKFCPSIELVGEASNIDDAYTSIAAHKPEVVFLDVQMPGGSGFDLLKKFKEIDFHVIFVTGYDQYAIEAIKLSALYYLLKPIEVEDLIKAVNKLEKLHNKLLHEMLIENAISNSDNVEKKLSVHFNDQVVFLCLNEITHFLGERNYTVIHTLNSNTYTSSKNLGEYEDLLKGFPCFFRIRKNCLANINHISNYAKGEPCFITINGSITYEVSRRRKQGLKMLLQFKDPRNKI